jgi:hypothetical protein
MSLEIRSTISLIRPIATYPAYSPALTGRYGVAIPGSANLQIGILSQSPACEA